MDPKNIVVLLEGKFDTDKLNAKLKKMLAKEKDAHLKVADDDKVAHYKVRLPKMAIPQAGNLPDELVLAPLDDNFVIALERNADSATPLPSEAARRARSRRTLSNWSARSIRKKPFRSLSFRRKRCWPARRSMVSKP